MLANWCARAVGTVFRPVLAPASARFQSTLPQLNTGHATNLGNLPPTLDEDVLNAILQQRDAFSISSLVTVEHMFLHRMHLGHKTSTLNPHMRPFIFGSRFDHLIIDLEKSRGQMIAALNFVAHIAYKDGIILFITRNHQTAHKVEKCAKDCSEFAHTRQWRTGLFTNSHNFFGTETRLPDCVIFLSTKGSEIAINECAKMLIPTVGVVDTDSDPRLISYPIAGNDDTPATCNLYCNYFKTAILRGKERRKNDLSRQESQIGQVETEGETLKATVGAPSN